MPDDKTEATESAMMPFADAFRLIGISRNGAHQMRRKGTFPVATYKVGSRWMVRRADIERLVGKR